MHVISAVRLNAGLKNWAKLSIDRSLDHYSQHIRAMHMGKIPNKHGQTLILPRFTFCFPFVVQFG